MPVRKMQVFFVSTEGPGWSESYNWQGTVVVNALVALLDQFVQDRSGILTNDCKVQWIRMQGLFPRDPLIFDYESRGIPDTRLPEPVNQLTDALLMRLECNGVGFNRIFMHGVPDSLATSGNFLGNLPWTQAFNKLSNNIKNSGNFGVTANVDNPQMPLPVISLTQNTPRGIKLLLTPPGTLTVPSKVRIKGASMMGYNGIKNVVMGPTPAAPTLYILGGAKPQADNPLADVVTATPLAPRTGNVEQFFVERLTSHRVGRPFGQRRGRRQTVLPLRR